MDASGWVILGLCVGWGLTALGLAMWVKARGEALDKAAQSLCKKDRAIENLQRRLKEMAEQRRLEGLSDADALADFNSRDDPDHAHGGDGQGDHPVEGDKD